MSNTTWNNNAIQFPRLLAEIMATQNLDMEALAESMDLDIAEINQLFDRADSAWEAIKAGEEPTITIDLNVYDDEGNVVDATDSQMTLAQISDVIDHASQLILVRRDDGDLDPILDELDEALSVSGVLDAAN